MAKIGNSAKHMFFYLLILFTLGFTAIGIGQILFQVINAAFPETFYNYDSFFSEWSLRFGLSAVIITAPVYWLMNVMINRELGKGHLNPDSAVRKWLTYFFLFVSAVVVVSVLIGVLNGFLGGELTVKFFLKMLAALLIASLILAYYSYDIRRENFETNRIIIAFRVIFFTIVIGSLIFGFSFLNSPWESRARREDDERLNRLRNVSYWVEDYFYQNQRLPDNLSLLKNRAAAPDFQDPVTSEQFEYRVMASEIFELCAVFSHSNRFENDSDFIRGPYVDTFYLHDAGRYCFEKKIEKRTP